MPLRRRRGLGASHDQDVRVVDDLVVVHGNLAVLVGGDHAVHEIVPRRLESHALLEFVVHESSVFLDGLGGDDAGGRVDEELHKGVGADDLSDAVVDLELVEDRGDPGVHARFLQTAKGFAKGEVTDHVKGRVVVPLDKVDGLSLLGVLLEPLKEQVDVAADHGFLVGERLLREAMGEQATAVAVALGVGGDDAVGDVLEKGRVLQVLGASFGAVSVAVFPGLRAGKGDGVGGDSHGVAVLIVQVQEDCVALARALGQCLEDRRDGPELGAWDLAKRVEEEVVDDAPDKVEADLGVSVSVSACQRASVGWAAPYHDRAKGDKLQGHRFVARGR